MLITAKEAMDKLKIRSPKTLRKLIVSGELKAIKVGDYPSSPLRIDEQDLKDYIERQTVRRPEAVNQ